MKAIRATIIAEQTLRFEAFKLPKKLTGAQVLVQTERTVVSAGTELANYTGLEADTRKKGAWCAYPWTPGYGGVGRVLAVGPDVKKINPKVKPGARVYGIFTHASHVLVDLGRELCVPVPDDLDATEAVLGRMCGVAITAYQRARVTLGETVVVFGLGLVGNLAGQFFARAGADVIGLDTSAPRRALASQTGFGETLDPTGLSEKRLAARLLKRADGARPAVVVDAVGDSRIIERAAQIVADNGQVVLLGTPRAPYHTDSTALLKRVHFHGISVVGALEWTIPLLKRQSRGVSTEANTELIFRLIAAGGLQVMPLCSHVLPPADLDSAYQGLLHRKDAFLGVVLDWENHPPPVPEDSGKKTTNKKGAVPPAAAAPRAGAASANGVSGGAGRGATAPAASE